MSDIETPNTKRNWNQQPTREPTETEALTTAYAANVEAILSKTSRISELQRDEINIRNQISELQREATKLREAQRAIHSKLEQLTK